jgi:hypothetical protein
MRFTDSSTISTFEDSILPWIMVPRPSAQGLPFTARPEAFDAMNKLFPSESSPPGLRKEDSSI